MGRAMIIIEIGSFKIPLSEVSFMYKTTQSNGLPYTQSVLHFSMKNGQEIIFNEKDIEYKEAEEYYTNFKKIIRQFY